jgi:hypothetical protein
VNKADVVREVLAELGQDAPAPDVAAIVRDRYGVNVSAAYVRVCRSRDAREASAHAGVRTDGIPGSDSPRPARIRPAPLTVPALRPRAPVRPSPRADEADPEELEIFRKIDRVVEAINHVLSTGNPLQVTGSESLVREISDICDDEGLRADYPAGWEYEIFRVPDGRFALAIKPARIEPIYANRVPVDTPVSIPVMTHERRRTKEVTCEFCNGRRSVAPGTNLYRVQSPVFGPRPIILCQMHAQPESTVPGTNIQPYRMYGEQFSANVIVPRKSAYQKMIDTAKSVFLGQMQDNK